MGFERVANWSRCAVGVNVADVAGFDLGIAHGVFHHTESAFVLGCRLRDVVSISRHAVAHDFRHRLGTACTGMLQFFENHNSRAFTNNEAIAVAVPWAAGSFGIVVSR